MRRGRKNTKKVQRNEQPRVLRVPPGWSDIQFIKAMQACNRADKEFVPVARINQVDPQELKGKWQIHK